MMKRLAQHIAYLAIYIPIVAFLTLSRLVPLARRSLLGGRLIGFAAQIFPSVRKRIQVNLKLIFPDMSGAERVSLGHRNAVTMGRTLTEILFNEDQLTEHDPFDVSGNGLEAVHSAKAEGRGLIFVSGHFGQWDAARIYLKEQGLEVGAIYRPNNNPYYEPHFLRGIEAAGKPIFARGPEGLKAMIRHIRSGGWVAILADQHLDEGAVLPFLGRPSYTTLSPAQMALRYNAALVPVFGVRDDVAGRVRIVFEEPIPPTTAEEMMTDFNARLEAQIRAHPEQWLWAHRRWKLG
jgi:KDO2-lipid IV(A) lauroyltransferase